MLQNEHVIGFRVLLLNASIQTGQLGTSSFAGVVAPPAPAVAGVATGTFLLYARLVAVLGGATGVGIGVGIGVGTGVEAVGTGCGVAVLMFCVVSVVE